MITYLRLVNYRSFKDVYINFQRKKDVVKNLSIIYGVNGAGKSTIVQSFSTLKKTMHTMQMKEMLLDLIEQHNVDEDSPMDAGRILDFLKARLSDNTLEGIIKETKMKGSKDDMLLEVGFLLDGAAGMYQMEFDEVSIVHERLEYVIKKNRGCLFDISESNVEINANIFCSDDYLHDIYKKIQKYWGKHTLMSILKYECEEKATSYVEANISSKLLAVINELDGYSYNVRKTTRFESFLNVEHDLLFNIKSGVADVAQQQLLMDMESVISDVFSKLFQDVNRAFYLIRNEGDKLYYNLYLNKQIDGRACDIDFENESSGTHEILDILPYIMLAIAGKTVLIDEYGTSIHDVLASRIINIVSEEIRGQLILTTHNMMLMDQEEIAPDALYYIMSDGRSNKMVTCITQIEHRLHPNYNYRNRYLTNPLYAGALPGDLEELSFKEMAKLYE